MLKLSSIAVAILFSSVSLVTQVGCSRSDDKKSEPGEVTAVAKMEELEEADMRQMLPEAVLQRLSQNGMTIKRLHLCEPSDLDSVCLDAVERVVQFFSEDMVQELKKYQVTTVIVQNQPVKKEEIVYFLENNHMGLTINHQILGRPFENDDVYLTGPYSTLNLFPRIEAMKELRELEVLYRENGQELICKDDYLSNCVNFFRHFQKLFSNYEIKSIDAKYDKVNPPQVSINSYLKTVSVTFNYDVNLEELLKENLSKSELKKLSKE